MEKTLKGILLYYRDTYYDYVTQCLEKTRGIQSGEYILIKVTTLADAVEKIAEGNFHIAFIDPFAFNNDLGGESACFTDEVKAQLPDLFRKHLKSISHRYLLGDMYYKARFEGMDSFLVDGEQVFACMIHDMYLENFLKKD